MFKWCVQISNCVSIAHMQPKFICFVSEDKIAKNQKKIIKIH